VTQGTVKPEVFSELVRLHTPPKGGKGSKMQPPASPIRESFLIRGVVLLLDGKAWRKRQVTLYSTRLEWSDADKKFDKKGLYVFEPTTSVVIVDETIPKAPAQVKKTVRMGSSPILGLLVNQVDDWIEKMTQVSSSIAASSQGDDHPVFLDQRVRSGSQVQRDYDARIVSYKKLMSKPSPVTSAKSSTLAVEEASSYVVPQAPNAQTQTTTNRAPSPVTVNNTSAASDARQQISLVTLSQNMASSVATSVAQAKQQTRGSVVEDDRIRSLDPDEAAYLAMLQGLNNNQQVGEPSTVHSAAASSRNSLEPDVDNVPAVVVVSASARSSFTQSRMEPKDNLSRRPSGAVVTAEPVKEASSRRQSEPSAQSSLRRASGGAAFVVAEPANFASRRESSSGGARLSSSARRSSGMVTAASFDSSSRWESVAADRRSSEMEMELENGDAVGDELEEEKDSQGSNLSNPRSLTMSPAQLSALPPSFVGNKRSSVRASRTSFVVMIKEESEDDVAKGNFIVPAEDQPEPLSPAGMSIHSLPRSSLTPTIAEAPTQGAFVLGEGGGHMQQPARRSSLASSATFLEVDEARRSDMSFRGHATSVHEAEDQITDALVSQEASAKIEEPEEVGCPFFLRWGCSLEVRALNGKKN